MYAFVVVTMHDAVGIKDILHHTDTWYIKMGFVESGFTRYSWISFPILAGIDFPHRWLPVSKSEILLWIEENKWVER